MVERGNLAGRASRLMARPMSHVVLTGRDPGYRRIRSWLQSSRPSLKIMGGALEAWMVPMPGEANTAIWPSLWVLR